MKTEISNTLFKFISLRSPQLINRIRSELLFATVPRPLETSVFYQAIAQKLPEETKSEVLTKAADEFIEIIPDSQHLNTDFPEMSSLAHWFSQNKRSASEKEIRAKFNQAKPLAARDLENLWENLFYQTIRQTNMSLKDELAELLLADHLVRRLKNLTDPNSDPPFQELLDVQITLPSLLFDETKWEVGVSTDKLTTELFLPNETIERKKELSKALLQINNYESLTSQLAVIDHQYQLEFERTLESVNNDHNDFYKEGYKGYFKDVSHRRREFILSPPKEIYQNVSYLDYIHEEIETPKISKFEIEYNPPIEEQRLRQLLTPVNYQTLLDILRNPQQNTQKESSNRIITQSSFDSIHSFNQFYNLIDRAKQKTETKLVQNAAITQSFNSIGGVLFSTPQSFSKEALQYVVIPIKEQQTYCATICFTLPDTTWELSKVTVKLRPKNSTEKTIVLQEPILERRGNEVTIYNIEGFVQNSANETCSMAVDLQFSNGQLHSIPQVELTRLVPHQGPLKNHTPIQPEHINRILIPKRFGVRMLGIADYKKVEQTIHCYIEGEVSHVENIMAREYKEKANRSLFRNEISHTLTEEQETEHLTDTISTQRFEMQYETEQVLRENKSTGIFVNSGYKYGNFYIDGGLTHANNSSRDESIRRSVNEAREITEQALDRLVKKTKRERITKIINESEENNLHGFDNRKGDQHVVGVYRWIDKLYKNQVYNYGKRMMFEFMIPEPGHLHGLVLQQDNHTPSVTLNMPIDPRTAGGMNSIPTAAALTPHRAQFWAAQYFVDIPILKSKTMNISAAFSDHGASPNFSSNYNSGASHYSVEIPEDYVAVGYQGRFNFAFVPKGKEYTHGRLTICENKHIIEDLTHSTQYISRTIDEVDKSLDITFTGNDVAGISVSLQIRCRLKDDAEKQWQQDTFSRILDAYYEALSQFNEAVKAEQDKAVEIKKTNPGFYREIENTTLRRNCISYLVAQSDMGQNFTSGNQIDTFSIIQNASLDRYSSLIKFLEQAFEWKLMSYQFYPYYWADRNQWNKLYNFNESDDPIFRDFMQSGMARVIVTVRPGFEEAVQLYMSTGKLWNGGKIPVIGDPLYLSVIDEIRTVKTEKEGKAWITRVPTSLTILQAQSIGLTVEKALPCNCEDTADFDDPTQVPCSESFILKNDVLQGEAQ